ncbi:hypothetical protein E2C01_022649 [Portunus trituberculatus]|uniref:Uncharacterized protein n=1 Tax=Portunus trituberculatus TaxID=210409 RepID=A0A5B7E7N4_PORTR|nr:hypothetical protein [Portunus trituberculatus]
MSPNPASLSPAAHKQNKVAKSTTLLVRTECEMTRFRGTLIPKLLQRSRLRYPPALPPARTLQVVITTC